MKIKMPENHIQIRCSTLTNYSDCARRAVCTIILNEIKNAGYEFRDIPRNIGAAVGTSTHLGVETILTEKLNGKEFKGTNNSGLIKDALEKAISKFDEIVQEGVEWDTLTPNRNDAQKQIHYMLKEYLKHVVPQIKPIALEKTFRIKIDDTFILKGTIDVLEKGRLRDLKTGRMSKNNLFQYGGYKLLAICNGYPINEIKEDFIPRKVKPKTKIISISPEKAELETRWLIERITRDIMEFLTNSEKTPSVFSANPHTQLCSERFCPAWGTKWCLAGKVDG